jgi:hypothetical protein
MAAAGQSRRFAGPRASPVPDAGAHAGAVAHAGQGHTLVAADIGQPAQQQPDAVAGGAAGELAFVRV